MRKLFCFLLDSKYQLNKLIAFTLFLLAGFGGCKPETTEPIYRIGFSQCNMTAEWRRTMVESMKRELSFHPTIGFEMMDADGSSEKQIEQIEKLISTGLDLLIVSPNETMPLTPAVEKAYSLGIPVIILDRRIGSDQYTVFVGADNQEVGFNAGIVARNLLKGKGKVIEIGEVPGSSANEDRHKGFMDAIANSPGIEISKKFEGDWNKYNFESLLENYLKTNPGIDLIYAQNDRFALRARKICEKLGLEKKIMVVGVDGLGGENGGLDLVAKGLLKATVLYPTGGEESILSAVNILMNKPYEKEIRLNTTIIDSSNVRIVKLQEEKVRAQQLDIDRRQQKINEQIIISQNQTKVILAISILLALAIVLAMIVFYYLGANKKINRQLAQQNEEIISQRNQLIEISAVAREANEAKFNFFTNISHEFRTPLTLIMAPLEVLGASKNLHPSSKMQIQLIQRSVNRLLHMVNQLIDFRKLEVEKIELKASENDLVKFSGEILEAFGESAKRKGIELKLFTAENQLPVWFDINLLDKVLFNLLSNAMKFTPKNGFVHLSIQKNKATNMALVLVQDSGMGMNPNEVTHAFDMFYQGDSEAAYKGSGIGLSLSRQLVIMHQGKLSLESQPGKGSIFTLELPLGNQHLQPHQMVSQIPEQNLAEKAELYTNELLPIAIPEREAEETETRSHTLLLADDNSDLLSFLSLRLGRKYDIIAVNNGKDALEKAFDELPDLVISDMAMAGKTGLELAEIMKNDVRTAHIPFILLTAKTATIQQSEGYKSLVDAYIPKPFNMEVLENQINSLLVNRQKMKAHFTAEKPLEAGSQSLKKTDRRFVNDFCGLVESNIANEHFKVEDICTAMGISRVQLYRKVKALMGCNINDYILDTRLQKARFYLVHENLPVSEVAYKTGFSSPAYFSTVFKARMGQSPSALKN